MDTKRKFAAAGVGAVLCGGALFLATSGSDANAAAHHKSPPHAQATALKSEIRHDCSAGSFPVTVLDRVQSGSVVFHVYVPGDKSVPSHDYDPSLGRVFAACLLTGHGPWAIDADNWPDGSYRTTIGVDPGHPTVVILSGGSSGAWKLHKVKI